MSEIQKPDYRYYSRLKKIRADEAQWILADIELTRKGISDQNKYVKLLEEEMNLAFKVLVAGFEEKDSDNKLNYGCIDKPYEETDFGDKHYFLSNITLNITEFCAWTFKKRYKLPEELSALATSSSVAGMDQKKEGYNGTTTERKDQKTVAPVTDNLKTVEGLLKMVIAMAMDCYGYNPADLKSSTTADIMNALANCGLSVSENTIRERLKQAQSLLPRDQVQQKTQ